MSALPATTTSIGAGVKAHSKPALSKEAAQEAAQKALQAKQQAKEQAQQAKQAKQAANKAQNRAQLAALAEKQDKSQHKAYSRLAKALRFYTGLQMVNYWLNNPKNMPVETDSAGNVIVDLPVTENQAEFLNLVADNLDMTYRPDSAQYELIPAQLTLNASQKAVAASLKRMGYIDQVGDSGWIFTTAGLALYGIEWQTLIDNYTASLKTL